MVVKVNWTEEPNYYGQQKEGWAKWSPGYCEITAKKPRHIKDSKRMEVLGHELLHCTDYGYH